MCPPLTSPGFDVASVEPLKSRIAERLTGWFQTFSIKPLNESSDKDVDDSSGLFPSKAFSACVLTEVEPTIVIVWLPIMFWSSH
ncbi:MAG: hypothetical protein DRQ78_01315 [Epsilonproteobacteria bacterium]|nr:MAG: hypothetical protein DRQ78_01315 [Campylobacterota bacterium]